MKYIKCGTEKKEMKKNKIVNELVEKRLFDDKKVIKDSFYSNDDDLKEDIIKKKSKHNKYDSFDFKYNDNYEQIDKKNKQNYKNLNGSLEMKYIENYDKIEKNAKKQPKSLHYKNIKNKSNFEVKKSRDTFKEY